MADKYANFAELALHEPPGAYRIRHRSTESSIAVIAPHGGAIEPGTSEIALAIAGDDLSYYLFDGQKTSNNAALHITSTNFDEPVCARLIATADRVLAIHGERSEDEMSFLGGRDELLTSSICAALQAAQFNVARHDDPQLQGTAQANVVNRGKRGEGVQLELSAGLRHRFFASLDLRGRGRPTPMLAEFARAVRSALRCHGG